MAVDPDHTDRTILERRDPLLGEVFDRRFRIDARIAAGGFGAIYRATHIKSGQQLALKVLHAKLTGDPGVVARFRREGAALTRLRDPHTITAYELGEAPDGTLYIVMELLRGESLYERFRARGPLPWVRMLAIARGVCSSLIEAHALGIIHRDLKPTNIHLEPQGPDEDFVKVLDFGIAKIVQESEIDSTDLTHAGQMIGTLDYMSPEQMVGGVCAPASDIYTLGVVMYEMIAGRKPFDDANSPASALAAVLTTTPPRLSVQAVIPADVDRIVMRCLERHHPDRYQSAAALATAIDEVLASGEEAVTTVDLHHTRGSASATIAGMRLPARPPMAEGDRSSAGAPRAAAAGMMPFRPAATDPAALFSPPAAAAGAVPVDLAFPTPRAAIAAPVDRSDPRPPRLTPTPTPVVHASSLQTAPVPRQTPSTPRAIPVMPRLIADTPVDLDSTLVGHLPTRAPAPPAAVAAASGQVPVIPAPAATSSPSAPGPAVALSTSAQVAAPASAQVAAMPAPASAQLPTPTAPASGPRAAMADPVSAQAAAALAPPARSGATSSAPGSLAAAPAAGPAAMPTSLPVVPVAMQAPGPAPLLTLTPPRRQTGAAPIDPLPPNRNLRESHPMIQRPLPSPMRPSTILESRSTGTGAVFDMSRVVRRDALVRRVALAVAVAITIAAGILVATRW